MEKTNSHSKLMKLVVTGLMAALVFVGNYFQIQIPNGVLVTRIHLGNSMCLLAGLLFSSMTGGFASGIGAGLFDLLNPAYILSSPYTFISKFAMGWTAGKLNRRNAEGKIPLANTIIAAVSGQLVYILLYLVKSFFTVLIIGGTTEAAWAAVGTNAVTSSINAALAVVIAVPLYIALREALKRTPIKSLVNEQKESKGYFNPVTIALTVFAFAVTTIYSMNLAAQTKLQKAQDEKEAAYSAEIDELNHKVDYLYEKLGVEPEQTTAAEQE